MFGADILVAPVLNAGQVTRRVWLPEGQAWVSLDGERLQGGQWISALAPLERIPVFVRAGSSVEEMLVR